jgi:hypothetical protein
MVPVAHRGAPSDRRGSLEVSGRNELHDFVLAHRRCAHMLVDLGPDTESGYRLVVTCDCGTEFMRWAPTMMDCASCYWRCDLGTAVGGSLARCIISPPHEH